MIDTNNETKDSVLAFNVWFILIICAFVVGPLFIDDPKSVAVIALFSLPILIPVVLVCSLLFYILQKKFKQTSKAVYKYSLLIFLILLSIATCAVLAMDIITGPKSLQYMGM